jgi:acetylornithine/N-succinyldiaminopimelate aminotransferase
MLSPLLNVYGRFDLEFIKGKGCYLYGSDGKKYLDLAAGIAVNSLGYANPKLIKTLKKHANKPWHVSNLYQIPGQEEFAAKLVKATGLDYVYFCNSGTEAVEAGIKIIRKYFNQQKNNKAFEIINFENGFHGRTIAAISAAGSDKYQKDYQPLLPGFKTVSLKNINIKKIEAAITSKTAAIMLEPIQGEGGVYQFSDKLLQQISALCKKKKILLMLDEVQCGMGRTGKIFHYQWSGIKPDILASAKGIGAGFPVSACIVSEEVGRVMTPGTHGGTYGGNPLAMAVGNQVFDIISQEKFLEQVLEVGAFLKNKLENIQQKFDFVEDIRGAGLMLGMKIKGDHYKLVSILQEHNILTVPASNNIVRLLPPLLINKKDIEYAAKQMEVAFCEFN